MDFEQRKSIIEMYITSAQSHMQLAAAALGLSITFVEKLLGAREVRKRDFLLTTSWLLFLFAIGMGALYQYTAIKWLDSTSMSPGAAGWLPESIRDNPGNLFGTMQVAFYLGAMFFVATAIKRLRSKN